MRSGKPQPDLADRYRQPCLMNRRPAVLRVLDNGKYELTERMDNHGQYGISAAKMDTIK